MSTKTVNGTSATDTITITTDGSNFNVLLNPGGTLTPLLSGDELVVNGNYGNDNINLSNLTSDSHVASVTINGGSGNDTLTGSQLNDTFLVYGTGEGYDTYYGEGGDNNIIQAQVAGTNIGLKGSFGSGNNINEINATGLANVTVIGDDTGTTLDFSSTKLTNVVVDGRYGDDTVIGNGEDNILRGGAGNDTLYGGGGNDTFLVYGTGEGYDTYYGEGGDNNIIQAQVAGTNIGLKGSFGSGNNINEINATGLANVTVIGDDTGTTLDFSSTKLTNVVVDGRYGDDTVIGNGEDNILRGGAGNDTLYGGGGNDTFLVYGTGEGYDTYKGDDGDDIIKAQVAGTNIGLKGNFDSGNSIKEITADVFANVTVIGEDTANTLDFSTTKITGVAVDGRYGNDTITTALSANTSGSVLYNGGSGADVLRISLTLSQAQNAAVMTQINAFKVALPQSPASPFNFSTLGFKAVNFESAEAVLSFGNALCAFDNVIVGTNGPDTLNGLLDSRNLILGLNYDDVITGGNKHDIIIGGHGNDTINGGDGDDCLLYAVGDNGLDVVNGGTGYDIIVATENNTVIGLASGYGSNGNEVELITANGNSNVKVMGSNNNSGDTLNFSNTEIAGIAEINGGNYDDIITTSNKSSAQYRGAHGNDVFNIGDKDATFLYGLGDNGFDSFTGNGDEVTRIVAVADSTVIGLASGFGVHADGVVADNDVDEIYVGDYTGVKVRGTDSTTGDIYDFSNVKFTGNFEIDSGNYNDEITTSNQSAGQYRGAHGNDIFHIGDKDATFLYGLGDNGFDSFTGNDAEVTKIVAGTNNTVIGLASGFGVVAGSNVDEIDVGSYTGIKVRGTDSTTGDTYDFSNVKFTGDFEIDSGNYNDEITTSNVSAGQYRGAHGNDIFHIGTQNATFLYGLGDNGFDSFTGNGAEITRIVAGADSTVIGLASGFGILAGNNVDEISVVSDTEVTYTGVKVRGTDSTTGDFYDFSNVKFTGNFEIDSGNYNDEITTSNVSAGQYRGAHGNDIFHIGTQNATFLYGLGDNGFDFFTGNDAEVTKIVAGANNTVIGLASGFGVVAGSNVDEIDVGSYTGVKVRGTDSTTGDIYDFSKVKFTGNFEIDSGNYNDEITTSNISAGQYRGAHGNDIFHIGDKDATFLYGLGDNGFDSFTGNGAEVTKIVAGADNSVIGLASGFGILAGSNVDEISVVNVVNDIEVTYTGVKVMGTNSTTGDFYDFSNVKFTGDFEIDSGNYNDKITTSNVSAGRYRGAHGDDLFNIGSQNATFLYGLGDNGFDSFTGNGAEITRIVAGADNTVIGLASGFGVLAGSNVDEIDVHGYSNVKVNGTNGNDTLNFSSVNVINDSTTIALEINGGNGNDTITGNNQANNLHGGEGNDTIKGSGGNDKLYGDGGNDTFLISGGSDGLDTMNGGSGSDKWLGSTGTDYFYVSGVTGNLDNLISVETIDGSGGYDKIIATGSADTLNFSVTGAPVLVSIEEIDGGGGVDTITGTGVADVIRGNTGNDTLYGGNGNDTFLVSGGSDGLDSMYGGEGADKWLGSTGTDYFYVTSGLANLQSVETIDGSGGYDKIIGTSDADTLNFSEAVGTPTLFSIEEIDGGGGVDTITGTSVADVIRGNTGNDALYGGDGNDTFLVSGGSDGLDTMYGGDGNDTWLGSTGTDYFYVTSGLGNLNAVETIDGSGGYDKIIGTSDADTLNFSEAVGTPTLFSIEEIDGGGGVDTITGTSLADVIRGNTGNDALYGGDGNDTFLISGGSDGLDTIIDGGNGTDKWLGSTGTDYFYVTSGLGNLNSVETIDGNGGYDIIIGTSDADTLDFSASAVALGAPTLANIEEIDGGGGVDTITGTGVADVIRGNTGNDALYGGDGNDTFLVSGGSDGLDTIHGGNDTDTWLGSTGTDYFYVNSDLSNLDSVEIINGSGGYDKIIATNGGDIINFSALTLNSIEEIDAGAGNDFITGTGSANTLRGGTGVDSLFGGGGVDTFLFSAGETGITATTIDHIQDFLSGTDRLVFGGSVGNATNFFDAGVVGNFAAAKIVADTAMNGTVQYVFADNGSNDSWLFFDRDMNGVADQAVELVGVTNMVATDIFTV